MNRQAQWILRFLRWFCPEHLAEEIEGDLVQKFYRNARESGERKATGKLFWNVLRFFRPGIILRNKFSYRTNHIPMIENYLKTTWRHWQKSKVNFFFKLGGLTLALVSFLVIAIYVSFQLSFDRYQDDHEKIYRVDSEWTENGSKARYAIVPPGIGPALKAEFPEINAFTRVGYCGQSNIKYGEKALSIYDLLSVDTSFFDIFQVNFLRGDRHSIDRPNTIILTRSMSRKIFGEEDPMNRMISFIGRSDVPYEVTGLIEDMPSNSHLDFTGLMPYNSLRDSMEIAADPWGISIDGSQVLYLKFQTGISTDEFALKTLPVLRGRFTKREDGMEKTYAIQLRPLKDIYLAPAVYAEFCKKGRPVYVYIFSLLGIFLLAIASINYVNLSIAEFQKRNKEIGVRKILGARKKQIVFQVSLEALFMCTVALVLAIASLYFIFPQVLQTLDDRLNFSMILDKDVSIPVMLAGLVLIFFSTAFPAYRLSVNNPVMDLKAVSAFGRNSSAGRILLLAQFTISIICITATFIVGDQLRFIHARNPGYDRENTIVLAMPDRYPDDKIKVIKQELGRIPVVDAVSYSAFRIAAGGYYRDWYRVEIGGEMKQMMLNEIFFDHDFFRAMGIEVVAGRAFDPANSADAHEAFIVNETAVREFGWDDPIGKRISYGYKAEEGEKWEGTIIGVVKDFNIYSMRKKIEPVVMRLPWSEWPGNCVHVKIHGPLEQTIAALKKKYEEILPDYSMDYSMISDLYESQYKTEQQAFSSLQVSTWVIVLISGLGIFSLSVYLSVRRMREFGIRKVLGASVRQITFLHAGQFLRIALVANLIALPVSYWIMRGWLDEFAYKAEPGVILFLSVALLSLLLVIVSSAYSSWKAGRMNPVDVIKIQ